MNCRSLERWVWQEGAGNLPAAAIAHASVCPTCRALIEQVRLLDRSVGAAIIPDPGDAYWDAMRERVAHRLDQPPDQVIVLAPYVPVWKRFAAHAWAPAMAVALLAVIASQRAFVTPPIHVPDQSELLGRVEAFSGSSSTTPDNSSQDAGPRSFRAQAPSTADASNVSAPTTEKKAFKPAPASETAPAKSELATLPEATAAEDLAAAAPAAQPQLTEFDSVWPHRQVTIMGEVDSNSPDAPSTDDRRLAAQDPFGAYERQKADVEHGLESANTFASPGRLLEAPQAAPSRGSERLTPAERMRRFDELSELRELIARLESVPTASRAMSQWTQWTTAWYRLGMLSDQSPVLDSAITAVQYFQITVPVDSVTAAEWHVRRTHLETRRANLEQ